MNDRIIGRFPYVSSVNVGYIRMEIVVFDMCNLSRLFYILYIEQLNCCVEQFVIANEITLLFDLLLSSKLKIAF